MTGRGRSEQTAELYDVDVKACLGDRRGRTARLVRAGLAPATKRHNLAALRAFARYTKDADLLLELDDLKLEAPAPVVAKMPLSDDEWNGLDDAISKIPDDALRSAMEMISCRGFRVGAIPALSRRRVDDALETGALTFVSKRRAVTYSVAPFRHCLQTFSDAPRWKIVADLLCPGARAENRCRAARQRLQRAMRAAAGAAGIDPSAMYPHRLRRSYAEAFYAEVKGDLVRLRDHMGWADIKTAARYVSRDRREELDQVADRMRERRRGNGAMDGKPGHVPV